MTEYKSDSDLALEKFIETLEIAIQPLEKYEYADVKFYIIKCIYGSLQMYRMYRRYQSKHE